MEMALRLLREFGFPVLIALALAWMLWHQMERTKEATDQWVTMMQYVMDCQKK